MRSIQSFKPQGINESTQALADVCPIGKVFSAKNLSDTNVRKLLRGLAQEQVRYETSVFDLINRYIPNFDTSFIEEWEKQLGIPDECFTANTFTDQERRRNIIIKLAYLTLVTPQDFIDLATILLVPIEVMPSSDLSRFPLTFPITFGGYFDLIILLEGEQQSGFPYTFPLTFGEPAPLLFECLVNTYKQAYMKVIFTYETNLTQTPLLDANLNTIIDGDGNAIFVPVI